jgi:hypothetical protein
VDKRRPDPHSLRHATVARAFDREPALMPSAPEALRSRAPVRGGLLEAVIPGLGLLDAGFPVGRGFERARAADRYVTVSGLTEAFARADLAVWPLRIFATGDDLGRVQDRIDADRAQPRGRRRHRYGRREQGDQP